jgi:hypothetical protein
MSIPRRAAATVLRPQAPAAHRWSARTRTGRGRSEPRLVPAAEPSHEHAPANLRQGALHSLAWVSQQLAGLTPRGEIGLPVPELLELAIEVEFQGHRHGRLALAFGRGLTRQVGANMAHMADLEGRQLGAVPAAKEMARSLATELLQTVFGVDARFRFSDPQAMPPRPLAGEVCLALAFAEGALALSVGFGQGAGQQRAG